MYRKNLYEYLESRQNPEDIYYIYGQHKKQLRLKLTAQAAACLLYTSPSPRDRTRSRMPSSA